MSPWISTLLIASLSLFIPAAIVVGARVRFGALVVCAGASAAVFAVFWLLLGGASALDGSNGPLGIVPVLVLLGGLLLMFAAWTLALDASTHARRWQWVELLTIAGVASFAAVLISISPPDPCLFVSPLERFGPFCPGAANPLIPLLLTAGYFAGPAAALAYGLGSRVAAPRLRRALPEGLTLSRLGNEGDPQMEVTTEPL
jgi:hypothetical protein